MRLREFERSALDSRSVAWYHPPHGFRKERMSLMKRMPWLLCALCLTAFARAPWKSDVPDADLKWIDGSQLPLEGRSFAAATRDDL